MALRPFTKRQQQFAVAAAVLCLVAIPMTLLVSTILRQTAGTQQRPYLGVDPNHYEYAVAAFQQYPQSFMAEAGDQSNERKNARIWLLARSAAVPGKPAGQDHWNGPQGTGDCVAMNGSCAITLCLLSQIARGESASGGIVFPSYYYGVIRRSGKMFGYGQIPCRSSGAIPTLLAKNFGEFGPIFYHEVGADGIKYSGRQSDDWGCNGVPEKWLALGRSRPGGECYPIRSLAELRDAICNGYPCSYAGPFTPGRKYAKDGRNCMTWDGGHLGYHQMCVCGYDGSLGRGHEYFFIQNSHGFDNPPQHIVTAATKPLGDEPEGGFWVSWQTMQSMLDRKGEIWAFSAVRGFEPQDIDWSKILDQFRDEPTRAAPIQEKRDENADDRRAAVRHTDLAI